MAAGGSGAASLQGVSAALRRDAYVWLDDQPRDPGNATLASPWSGIQLVSKSAFLLALLSAHEDTGWRDPQCSVMATCATAATAGQILPATIATILGGLGRCHSDALGHLTSSIGGCSGVKMAGRRRQHIADLLQSLDWRQFARGHPAGKLSRRAEAQSSGCAALIRDPDC